MYYCGDQTGDYILGNGLLLTDCKYVLQDGLQDAISALDQLQNLDIEKFVFQCLNGDIPLSQPKATVINYGNYTNVFLTGFMTFGIDTYYICIYANRFINYDYIRYINIYPQIAKHKQMDYCAIKKRLLN